MELGQLIQFFCSFFNFSPLKREESFSSQEFCNLFPDFPGTEQDILLWTLVRRVQLAVQAGLFAYLGFQQIARVLVLPVSVHGLLTPLLEGVAWVAVPSLFFLAALFLGHPSFGASFLREGQQEKWEGMRPIFILGIGILLLSYGILVVLSLQRGGLPFQEPLQNLLDFAFMPLGILTLVLALTLLFWGVTLLRQKNILWQPVLTLLAFLTLLPPPPVSLLAVLCQNAFFFYAGYLSFPLLLRGLRLCLQNPSLAPNAVLIGIGLLILAQTYSVQNVPFLGTSLQLLCPFLLLLTLYVCQEKLCKISERNWKMTTRAGFALLRSYLLALFPLICVPALLAAAFSKISPFPALLLTLLSTALFLKVLKQVL